LTGDWKVPASFVAFAGAPVIVLEIILPFALVIGFCAYELWRLRGK
jgi:hypothetical protein